MSQIGDFIGVLTPCDSFFGAARFLVGTANARATLAHQGHGSQAGFRRLVLRRDAGNRGAAIAHSTWQNMQTAMIDLALAL
jgi:hypothetical protein